MYQLKQMLNDLIDYTFAEVPDLVHTMHSTSRCLTRIINVGTETTTNKIDIFVL